MATNILVRINNSLTDSSYAVAPSNYVTLDTANDYFIFSQGSSVVADGQTIPSQDDLNRAGVVVSAISATIVPKYILADISVALLKEIKLAGNNVNRYVFCASFDGATASEPILEAWDDNNMATYLFTCLGARTPNNSWFKAICTTHAAPSVGWAGTPLAGAGASNSVLLNGGLGALAVATDLYFNLKIIVPAGSVAAFYIPKLVITYTTN
jgi:hypothetical protein